MGELTSIANPVLGGFPAHNTSYRFNDAHQQTGEENDSRTVSYEVDSVGNRTKTIWPDTYNVAYIWDENNQMTYAKENGAVELAFYRYDTLSRRNYVCLGGTSPSCLATTGSHKIGYSYEPDSDIGVLANVLNAVSVTLSYSHNHSHQITGIVASDDFYLPRPSVASNTSYGVDALNRYSSVGSTVPNYDLNGNLTNWTSSVTGVTKFTYDAENRLRTVATNGSATPSIYYDYDALGRRIGKTVGGTGIGVGGTSTNYLLDGDEEIGEYSGSTLLRRYIMGSSVDDRVARAEGAATSAPTKFFYHTNHQGSVLAMTDATGVLQQQLAYDEYGNLTSAQPPAALTGESYRFTGRRFDPETGLYYYRARYYAPEIGRFLQTDPIGYKDDLNLYTYVGNDPLDKTDPTGQWAGFDDAIAIGAGALVGVVAQGFEDFSSGHLSSPGEYAASAAGGARAGETALYAVPTLGVAGLAGAAALGSAATDALKSVATGNSLDVKAVAINAAIAAATAGVPGVKSAAGALSKQLATKAEKGLIKSATNRASAKAIVGKAGADAGGAAAGGAAAGAKDRLSEAPRPPPTCSTSGTSPCGR